MKEETELRVWFRDEIRNILLSVLKSQILALDMNAAGSVDYRNAVLITINAVATAFGIDLNPYIQAYCDRSSTVVRGDDHNTTMQ